MAFNTVIQQGRFTSDGNDKTIAIRSDVDWMWVYNETILNDAALAADSGAQFYFQRGMTNGRGIEYRKLGTVANDPLTTLQIAADSGFFLINTATDPVISALSANSATNVTAGPPPRITLAAHGLETGDTVRLFDFTGAQQLSAFDHHVTRIDANNFDLTYMPAIVAAAAPGADAKFRKVNLDPIYYPRRRAITKISQASQAIVTLSVDHGFLVGQSIRFTVPEVTGVAFGMNELDGLVGNIVNTGQADADGETNTITVDIDTSGFSAFALPVSGDMPFTPAQATPIGIDSNIAITQNVNLLNDATDNVSIIGARLAAGANSPAGVNNDVIYWVAGKSFAVINE